MRARFELLAAQNAPKLLSEPVQHRCVGIPIPRQLIVLPRSLDVFCLGPADVRHCPHDIPQACVIDHSL
jgi:hypothetical protein